MRTLILIIAVLTTLPLRAESVYIDDQVMAGLHQEKNIDSPILKLLPAGTALEIIKRDTPLSQVKEPGGSSGWVDNRYLADAAPGRTQLLAAQSKISKLEAELTGLKSTTPAAATPAGADAGNLATLSKDNKELTQLLKSERLRVGELQAQTAELRNKLGKTSSSELQSQLDSLLQEKANLQKQLDEMQAQPAGDEQSVEFNPGEFDWQKMLICIGLSLIAGFIAGLLLLDWINRRRHGGFRI